MKQENSIRNDGSFETGQLIFSDIGDCLLETVHRTQVNDERLEGPLSYRLALGREIIHLGIVEFRILLFLASKPYFPFTRRRIADAVSTERHPVTEDTVDQHIVSLRNQLGFFHDYVQSVPHVGYRFKA
jgi:DNA-binding response OmpR family regulator